MVGDRDVLTRAHLEDEPGGGEQYSYHAAMLVHAGLDRTRRILTDYQLYSKIIPYVDRTDFSPATRILNVEGGIWKFRLHSLVRFEERGSRWVRYRIVGGHFTGLEGDIYFEPLGEKGTLVYFDGAQRAKDFPPKFVIERGAEIVFGFTAKRMRSYVESNEDATHEKDLPQPRSHL
jgi:hypothetical protein